jgi:hypothetical protein
MECSGTYCLICNYLLDDNITLSYILYNNFQVIGDFVAYETGTDTFI